MDSGSPCDLEAALADVMDATVGAFQSDDLALSNLCPRDASGRKCQRVTPSVATKPPTRITGADAKTKRTTRAAGTGPPTQAAGPMTARLFFCPVKMCAHPDQWLRDGPGVIHTCEVCASVLRRRRHRHAPAPPGSDTEHVPPTVCTSASAADVSTGAGHLSVPDTGAAVQADDSTGALSPSADADLPAAGRRVRRRRKTPELAQSKLVFRMVPLSNRTMFGTDPACDQAAAGPSVVDTDALGDVPTTSPHLALYQMHLVTNLCVCSRIYFLVRFRVRHLK